MNDLMDCGEDSPGSFDPPSASAVYHPCCNPFSLSGNFDVLPPELVLMLFSFLDIKELCLSTRVSHNWKLFCENPHIWRTICRKSFGCEDAHKKKRPSPYHTWKEHCIMVYMCVRANSQGKRAPAKDEEMCMFNHHRVHVPSLTTYLLLDLASFSNDQFIDWVSGIDRKDGVVKTQQEAKQEWIETCRSAIAYLVEAPSEEKGDDYVPILASGAQSSPFTVLLQAVVKLERMYLTTAFMNQNVRASWAASALAAADCHDVASLIETLERNISWAAVDPDWRDERTPWRTDVMKVMNRKTMERLAQQAGAPVWQVSNWTWNSVPPSSLSPEEKVRKALIELEQNVAWEAVHQRWRKERHAWLASLQATTEYPAMMEHLVTLEEVLRDSSFKGDWKEAGRAAWKERAKQGVSDGKKIDFTQFGSMLLELEANLLGGCFLPNWTFQVFAWRHPFQAMEEEV